MLLLHGDALCQIPGLVNVPVQELGAVIGQELAGDHRQNGIQEVEGRRDLNDLIHHLPDLRRLPRSRWR